MWGEAVGVNHWRCFPTLTQRQLTSMEPVLSSKMNLPPASTSSNRSRNTGVCVDKALTADMPLTAQLFATLDISLSADTLMMYHQSPYRGVTLGLMMVEAALGFLGSASCCFFTPSLSTVTLTPALQRGLCSSWRTNTFPSCGLTRLLDAFVSLHTWMYSFFMSL